MGIFFARFVPGLCRLDIKCERPTESRRFVQFKFLSFFFSFLGDLLSQSCSKKF